MSWFFREHTADIVLVARARSLQKLLREMVRALGEAQGEFSREVPEEAVLEKKLQGELVFADEEEMVWEFCDFLNYILSEAACASSLPLDLTSLQLREYRNLIEYEGTMRLISWEIVQEIKLEIKAVTYSGAYLHKKGFFWEWQICADV